MNNRLAIFFNTGKKKAAAAMLCGALVLSLGTLTAFAANDADNKVTIKSEDVDGVSTHSYSTDDGQTWNTGLPEGAVITTDENGEDGVVITYDASDENDQSLTMKEEDDVINSMSVKVEDGVTSYSTDGGKTWTEGVPEGVTTDEDGTTTVFNGGL